MKLYIILLITLSVSGINWAQEGIGFLFRKEIVGLAFPFYKLLLSLGDCNEKLAFRETNAYTGLRLNRLLDIYYKSGDLNQKVSQVDVTLITNNTNCIAFSNIGLGYPEFKGTVVIPNNIGLFIYTLEVYVCWDNSTEIAGQITTEDYTEEPTTDESYSDTEAPTILPHIGYKPWKEKWKQHFFSFTNVPF